MYEFIKRNDIGKQKIKQSSIGKAPMQRKMHMQSDKENCFHDVRVERKASVVPVVQMNTETSRGSELWNMIMNNHIPDTNIVIEDDSQHDSILAIVDLRNIEGIKGDEQLHMLSLIHI